MEIFFFHLMPWPYLPDDYDGTAWVRIPNSMYDVERGHTLMNEYLDQLVACEGLGFDGVGVNEHHQTAWGLMCSPNLAAGMLIARTKTLKILVMGPALPLYTPPLRVAEELALLDVISKGRIIVGPVIAGAPEYFAAGIPPAEARPRFNEALDLILRAWTEPGPFEHFGEYFQYQHVNPWPQPYQKPHPPVWIPGAGSIETIDLCVEKGLAYSALPFFPRALTENNYKTFRRKWLDAGRAPDSKKLSLLLPIYVAESDARARQEFEQHFWYFNNKLRKGIGAAAPGYTSEQSVLRMTKAMKQFPMAMNNWEDLEKAGYVIVGSPNTVIEKISERLDTLGAGNLLGMFQLGSMPHQMTMDNLSAFSTEVMPAIRAQFPDGPTWRD